MASTRRSQSKGFANADNSRAIPNLYGEIHRGHCPLRVNGHEIVAKNEITLMIQLLGRRFMWVLRFAIRPEDQSGGPALASRSGFGEHQGDPI